MRNGDGAARHQNRNHNRTGGPQAGHPARGRRCSADPSALALEIADLRDAGFSWKAIESIYGLSRATLWRYLGALNPEL